MPNERTGQEPQQRGTHEQYETARSKESTWEQLEPLFQTGNLELIRKAAKNPNVPAQELAKLASHENLLVVVSVAENPSTPVETLVDLAKKDLWHNALSVNRYVAKNPNLPPDVLDKLVGETNYWGVIKSVAGNSSTTEETLLKLLDPKFGKDREDKFMLEWGRYPDPEIASREEHLEGIAIEIAGRDNLSPQIAQKLLPRYAVDLAHNFNAPEETIREIAFGAGTNSESVAQMAQFNLEERGLS